MGTKIKKKKNGGEGRSRSVRQLTESVAAATAAPSALLTEVRASHLQVVAEAATPQEKRRYLVRVRGEFARAGVATENKRVYPKRLWEREINRLAPMFSQRSVFGELDHPDDGRTRLQRVSHIVTGMSIENGVVVGEAEILNTQRGRDLAALIEAGCKVGVSSRGYGSTRPDAQGQDVVQEDYRLATFDFVADPADKTAYPEVTEDSDPLFEGLTFDEEARILSELKDLPDALPTLGETAGDADTQVEEEDVSNKMRERLIEELTPQIESRVRLRVESDLRAKLTKELTPLIRESLQEEVTDKVLDELAGMRAKLEEKVRAEMLADPSVFNEEVERQAAELTQLREHYEEARETANRLSTQVEQLEEANAELAETARDLGFRFYLEQRLAGHPNGDLIRELVGNVDQYSSADVFKAKIEEVETTIQRRIEEEEAERLERQKLFERQQEKERVLAEEVNLLREAVQKSMQVNRIMGIQLYAEQRIARHPRAANIRAVLERVQPETQEEVDEIIEQFRAPVRSRDQIDETAARVRNMIGGGITALPREEEEPWQRPSLPAPAQVQESRVAPAPTRSTTGGFNGLGVSLEEMKRYMPPGADQ